MFKFANPEYLYLLALVPVLVVLHVVSGIRRRKKLAQYGDEELLSKLMPDVSVTRPNIKFWLLFAAYTLGCFLLARPQFGSKQETVMRRGIETVIALDISNSMLADDVTPSRLEKSKRIISNLVDQFQDDKIGLIVFAGDAFVQLPITSDFISAKVFLNTISPALITRQGTDIKTAIELATRSFTPNEGVGKAIIVITDGENHEGGAEEAARAAAEKGYMVYVMGVGLPSGSPIPGDRSGEFRKDREGNVVITRLDEEMCRKIAAAGKGSYFYVDNSNAAEKALQKEIDKLAKADIESTVYTEYDEQFQIIAWMILIILLFEIFICESRNPRLKNFSLFKTLMVAVMIMSATGVSAQRSDRSFIRKGNRLYEDSLFIKAEENYLKAIDVNPELYEGNYNLGNAYTAQQKPNEAVEQYRKTANALEARKKELMADPDADRKELEKCKKDLAQTYHNTGVVYHMSERYDKAVESYKEALRNNPLDDETRYNLILAQRMLKQQQQEQQQEQQDMSQENAEQILEAAMQDEKDVQERVQEQLMKVQPKKPLEKDW
ncbi:MAG: VWA domain-containing protein [Bacteroidaceae bacterium]|nr:VWA domain-containing protein [Bacteroidaceae bacterium]